MRQASSWRGWGAAALLTVVALVDPGCSVPQNVPRMEALMIKAGFHVKRADTPERLEHLKTLTPLKLVRHDRAGTPYYVFADPDGCQCVYVGNEAAYQQYQKLAQASQAAAVQKLAEASPGDGMRWGVWDPFFW
jgi:hypothetical protein